MIQRRLLQRGHALPRARPARGRSSSRPPSRKRVRLTTPPLTDDDFHLCHACAHERFGICCSERTTDDRCGAFLCFHCMPANNNPSDTFCCPQHSGPALVVRHEVALRGTPKLPTFRYHADCTGTAERISTLPFVEVSIKSTCHVLFVCSLLTATAERLNSTYSTSQRRWKEVQIVIIALSWENSDQQHLRTVSSIFL